MKSSDVYQEKGFNKSFSLSAPFGLLLVDFCGAFVHGDALGGGNIAAAAARSVDLLRYARERCWPVAHAKIIFAMDKSDANVWAEKIPLLLTLTESNPEADFIRELQPAPDEFVVQKNVASAFWEGTLTGWLRYKHHVKTVVIAGCTTSGCVRASAVDAVSYGFRTVVITDCVGDRSIAAHEASLSDLKAKYSETLSISEFMSMTEATT
ncbi:isochorismatase family protein [Paraburkholderia lycopersici]|uniref:Maleamate amidohydrolase n=1 Tax=Paraburkholderia lycopersici TaxID=416944 RepID=A0A1G7A141_9BURK|nr:isochorismatase family protein [Paraburkholderia lycopersici]SDE08542.1 maleamate amidohydrolase [Paraburkholderia lycopersici]